MTPTDQDKELREQIYALDRLRVKTDPNLPRIGSVMARVDDIVALVTADRKRVALEARKVTGDISDGYHTFNELYEFRLLYNAALFNEWAMYSDCPPVVKSWKHSDGELCFGGGWFVVTAQLPTGQITNHYEAKDWELFRIPEVEKAPEWDGHTPQDVAKRLREFLAPNPQRGEK